MMYLHIFEDGTINQSDITPTNDDMDGIEAGALTILRVHRETGKFQDLLPDWNWVDV